MELINLGVDNSDYLLQHENETVYVRYEVSSYVFENATIPEVEPNLDAPGLAFYEDVPEEITLNEPVVKKPVFKNLCIIEEELICMLNTTLEDVYNTMGPSVVYELDLDRE